MSTRIKSTLSVLAWNVACVAATIAIVFIK